MTEGENGAVEAISFKTSRLILRRPDETDVRAITREIGKTSVARSLATVPHPYTQADAINWLQSISSSWGVNSFTFGVYAQEVPSELIGVAGLSSLLAFNDPNPTLGYWLAQDYWGRGLMSEAVGAVLAFAFERLNAPSVEATYLTENPASGRVMEKNGFLQIEPTLLWSRFRMCYLRGFLMRCDQGRWLAAHKN